MINFIIKNFKKIVIVAASLVLISLIYQLIPKSQSSTKVAESNKKIELSEESSLSIDTKVSTNSVSSVSSSELSESLQIKTITKEKFRHDGSIESREVERLETSKVRNTSLSRKATESVVLDRKEIFESSSSVDLAENSSTSEKVILSERSRSSIGPAAWVTIEGTYAGFSYKVVDASILRSNLSLVVGTRLDSLPDLDLAVGGMVSSSVGGGLELGVVGAVKVPVPDAHIGIGISYQF